MAETPANVLPALRALDDLRHDIKTRIGKEGGNLNQKVLRSLDVIEATLHQLEPLGNMLKVVNQQSELAVRAYRDMSRYALPSSRDTNGDDGNSTTKGE